MILVFNTVETKLWKSYKPVRTVAVFWKAITLFVNKRSIHTNMVAETCFLFHPLDYVSRARKQKILHEGQTFFVVSMVSCSRHITDHNFHWSLHCVKSVRIRNFSGSYFLAFGLNKVFLRIQSECGKTRTRKSPNTDTFHPVLNSIDSGK